MSMHTFWGLAVHSDELRPSSAVFPLKQSRQAALLISCAVPSRAGDALHYCFMHRCSTALMFRLHDLEKIDSENLHRMVVVYSALIQMIRQLSFLTLYNLLLD